MREGGERKGRGGSVQKSRCGVGRERRRRRKVSKKGSEVEEEDGGGGEKSTLPRLPPPSHATPEERAGARNVNGQRKRERGRKEKRRKNALGKR